MPLRPAAVALPDWMHATLWRAPAQVRRRVPDSGGLRLAAGPAMPLSSAVRDAMKLLETEGVDIRLVDPGSTIGTIREVDILRLARRPDYPFAEHR